MKSQAQMLMPANSALQTVTAIIPGLTHEMQEGLISMNIQHTQS